MYALYGNLKAHNTIVAIPALGERKEMYIPLAHELSDYKWLVFDLPGSNKQQLEDYSIERFCEYIQITMKSLHIPQAHFIGNSIGAWIIQEFKSKYTNQVQSLVLLDGGHYFLGELEDAYEYVELPSKIDHFEDIQNAVQELTYSMPNLTKESYRHFEQYMLNNYIHLEDGFAHHCDEKAYNALSKEISIKDLCLKNVTIPIILLIAGASTGNYSFKKSKLFAKKYGQEFVEIITNGQHYLPLTNTQTVANSLSNFYKNSLTKLK